MPDAARKEFSWPTDDMPASGFVDTQAERKRLIDDLAFLVVRQHRHNQRTGSTEVPSHDTATTMLNSKQKRGI